MNLCHNTRLTRILRITSEYMAYSFPFPSDGWARGVRFATGKKDFTLSKDLLMSLQMETLLHTSDPT